MFFKKKGMPEPGELVICTVKKVLPHAAFVSLDEYERLEAMLHVSEISSRWVKNIKEFVTEGKKVVCKVLEMHRDRGHVDVSLKRVTNSEKNKKLNEEKTGIRIEKLIEVTAKKMNEEPKKALNTIGSELIEYFGSLADFYEFVKKEGVKEIESVEIPDVWKKELMTQIQEQLDAIRVKQTRNFEMKTFEEDGVDRINNFFIILKQFVKENNITLKMTYIAAPNYSLEITAKSYKEADVQLKQIFKRMDELSNQNKIELSIAEED